MVAPTMIVAPFTKLQAWQINNFQATTERLLCPICRTVLWAGEDGMHCACIFDLPSFNIKKCNYHQDFVFDNMLIDSPAICRFCGMSVDDKNCYVEDGMKYCDQVCADLLKGKWEQK